MKLDVIRKEFTNISSIGDFLIDGKWFYDSLEDKDRQIQPDGSIIPWRPDLKITNETAIPYGTYAVQINWSNRFKKLMPIILNVPNFGGIRIHNGDTAADTDGCILIGLHKKIDDIWESIPAFNDFFPRLEEGLKVGKVLLTISKGV
jgi:hypothetical protein